MRPTRAQVKMAAGSVDDPNLLDLPLELVEALVLAPALTIPDICAFSQVCWSLNHVVSRIWGKIAKSRWATSVKDTNSGSVLSLYTCVWSSNTTAICLTHCRWKYWGRVALGDCRESKDWYHLCRHRYLCEVYTHQILTQLMKKGFHVDHLSWDELDCFSDFLKKWECPVDVLLCVLDEILHRRDPK